MREAVSSFYLHLEVADRPGVLAQVADVLGRNEVSVRSVVQRGLGDDARLVMVMHAGPGGAVLARRSPRSPRSTSCAPPARDPGHRGGVHLSPQPLIDRYRDRLSMEPGDPVVTLNEGSTPLVEAPVISERVGARVLLKLEGANPTGSFKDRGMTRGRVARRRARAPRPSSARPPATRRPARPPTRRVRACAGAVIVPEGKIAIGKLAQALMHGARVIALRGNFDEALAIVRELARAAPDGARQLGQPVPDRGAEDGRVRGLRRAGRARPTRSRIPVGNAGNITAWWRGFGEYGAAPLLYGFQAAGAAPLVEGIR